MTKQDLDCHLELLQMLAEDLELLASLEAAAGPKIQRLDGMPHAHGISDPVGNLATEIADMRETVARRKAAVAKSEETILVRGLHGFKHFLNRIAGGLLGNTF